MMICKKGTRIPQGLKAKVREYIGELILRGILRKSDSQWRNPIRAIEKEDGSIRLVMSCMALNDICKKDSYSIPEIKRLIEATQGSNYLTVIDLKEGYYQIEIEEKDKMKTAFEFEGGVYEWCGMIMGYKNAPMVFQRIMCKMLEEKIGKGVEVYMDDILIHADNLDKHNKLVQWVLLKLQKNNMQINVKKIQFGLNEVKILGVNVNGREKIPLEIKKNQAMEYKRPSNFTELRRFLGLAGWFREFIPRFSILAEDLYSCLNKKKSSNGAERRKSILCD